MADPDAIRYLRIAQADLAEAQRSDSLAISPPIGRSFLPSRPRC